MSISLAKNQTISLTKESGGTLTKVRMGTGWDPLKKSGFFGKMFSSDEIDLDASVILFDDQKNPIDVVFFNKLKSDDGAIIHTGDNLTGEGEGDDESIIVNLHELNPSVTGLVFTVNSFQGQSFKEVDNAFCRLVDEMSGGKEIARFNLSEQGAHTGVIMAVLKREANDWSMRAVGKPMQGRTFQDMIPEAMAQL